jgi:hypothetical protein
MEYTIRIDFNRFQDAIAKGDAAATYLLACMVSSFEDMTIHEAQRRFGTLGVRCIEAFTVSGHIMEL